MNAFHQYSHNPECADAHSLRNSPNVGMVTGEEIETSWAILNHLQYSIREMDAGARIDMITTHMIHINELKIRRMGKSFTNNLTLVLIHSEGERMFQRLELARQEHERRTVEFEELEAALDEASAGTTLRYKELYEKNGGEQFRPDPHKVKR